MTRRPVKNPFLERIIAIVLMVFVVGGSVPLTTFAALSVDITADGQSSLTLSDATADFDIEVNATDATTCQIDTGSFSSGIAPGSSMNISPSHPAYPSAGGSTTFTVTCLDAASASLSDSVTVSLAAATDTDPTVDVDANGSDGPITINSGDTYTIEWQSTNSTACTMNPPVVSGVTLSGSSAAIGPGSPFYPAAGSSVTITISCTDGTDTATDSVVVNVASSGGGGGGGSDPTADIDANGSDGPITINSGDTYTLSWTSTNATACTMNPPVVSGISLSGTSVPISSGSPFYPTTSSPVTVTISCTNGTDTATDSVVINMASSTGGGGDTTPTIDVDANGSDGPVTLEVGDTYVYTWVSTDATACTMTSPVTSGVSLSGTSVTIDSSNTSFYPTLSSSVTITISCTDSDGDTATDSVVINLEDGDDGDNGGGGGGGRSRSSRGSVLGGSVECPWIHDYMRADFQNDPIEVMKLQAFLKVFMGYDYVTINGVFDTATVQAVGAFQMLYASEILTPWGHTAPTYYVYILTLKKVNELYCQEILPLTAEQQNEIVTFRSLVNQARQLGVPTSFTEDAVVPAELKEGEPVQLPIVGVGGDKGQNIQGLAAALFTFPDNLKDTMQCLYEFVLILLVLYALGTVLKDVLYANMPENALRRFLAKWALITLGLVAAMLGAFGLGELCLMTPLLLSTLFSLIWMSFYPKHGSIRASAKSWYAAASTKSKSLFSGKAKAGDSLSQTN